MAKNNEYVGVDDKYVPEEAQRKTHVQEPIIGSENAQKIRDGIASGVNQLTSDEGKEKVKAGAKKAQKIAKGIGYYMAIKWIIVTILAIGIFILSIVIVITVIGQMQRTQKEYDQRHKSTEEKVLDITHQ